MGRKVVIADIILNSFDTPINPDVAQALADAPP